jgi:SAM-dependent methyltransferase
MPSGFNSRDSEKEYGRSASQAAWEVFKPFSPPGASTLADSVPLIHDFATVVSLLNAGPTDLILDVGAGACWSSEWLQRLNLRSVAVDISLEMLKVGRTRMLTSGPARAVAGDIEHLPFATSLSRT